MTQPLIGLTLDSDEGEGISRTARYGMRANYADAIAEAVDTYMGWEVYRHI